MGAREIVVEQKRRPGHLSKIRWENRPVRLKRRAAERDPIALEHLVTCLDLLGRALDRGAISNNGVWGCGGLL